MPSGEEWLRFRCLARLTKDLTIHTCEDSEPEFSTHPNALDLLREHYPGPILPNLLRLKFADWAEPETVVMFIQPKLRSVHFTPVLPVPTSMLLECIETHAPKLESLKLSDDDDLFEEVRDQLSKTVCALKHLKRLKFGCVLLSSAALIHLSSLPNLHSLAFRLTGDNVLAWKSPAWGKFSKLMVLGVMTTFADATAPASLLESIDGQSLLGLTLRHYPDAQVTSLDRLFCAIGTLGRLVKLSLDFSTFARAWPDDRVPDAVLAPLARLPLIMDFTLRALPVALSRATLHALARGWPYLRRLSLACSTWSRRGPSADVRDLAVLARECPLIEHVDAEVAPLGDDWGWDVDAPGVKACPLQTLNLTSARVPRAVAPQLVAFLARIFPIATMTSAYSGGTFVTRAQLAEMDEVKKVMDQVCKAKNRAVDPVLAKQTLEARANLGELLDLGMLSQ